MRRRGPAGRAALCPRRCRRSRACPRGGQPGGAAPVRQRGAGWRCAGRGRAAGFHGAGVGDRRAHRRRTARAAGRRVRLGDHDRSTVAGARRHGGAGGADRGLACRRVGRFAHTRAGRRGGGREHPSLRRRRAARAVRAARRTRAGSGRRDADRRAGHRAHPGGAASARGRACDRWRDRGGRYAAAAGRHPRCDLALSACRTRRGRCGAGLRTARRRRGPGLPGRSGRRAG